MSKLTGIEQLRAARSGETSPASRAGRLREHVVRRFGVRRLSGPEVAGVARSIAVGARDMLYPLLVVTRGAGRGLARAARWWRATPAEKSTAVLFVLGAGIYFLVRISWGPIVVIGGLMALAAFLGRHPRLGAAADGEPVGEGKQLQSVYNGLVPYLMDEHDPDGLFRPGGTYAQAFTAWETDHDGRLRRLRLRYSPFFRDGDPAARRQVERALAGKLGRAVEFTCEWDEQANELGVTVLPPLPTGIVAAPWPVAGIEYVLGFTDDDATSRHIPVDVGGEARQLAPVVWRIGASSAQAHLIVAGTPGSGRSNLLRTLAAQATARGGYPVLLDGKGVGTFGTSSQPQAGEDGPALIGGHRSRRVEGSPQGIADALAWAVGEVERRHGELLRSRKEGIEPTAEVRRQMWVIVDDLAEACDAAAAFGLPDPREALTKLLRQGRLAHVTVVLALAGTRLDLLDGAVLHLARARVGLGRLDGPGCHTLFSTPLTVEGLGPMPPGRGYARIGDGDIMRLQVPLTPHDADDPDTLDNKVIPT